MKRKAFTLVELIVVITILAILGTIAFISLSGYSKEARDAKRITDTSSLLSKINIEETRGTPISELITNTEDVYLQILGNSGSLVKTFGKADFKTLKEDEKNFRDPSNKSQNYPMAYAIGGSGRDAYKFIQIATVSEKNNRNIIKGNYYKLEDNDDESLFLSGSTRYTEKPDSDLVYELEGINPKGDPEGTLGADCKGKTEDSYVLENTKNGEEIIVTKTDSDIAGGKLSATKTFLCKDGKFIGKEVVVNDITCNELHYPEKDECKKVNVNPMNDPNNIGTLRLVNGKLGTQDSYYLDSVTGLAWAEEVKEELQWAINNAHEQPTWNGTKYSYPSGPESEYPAFEYCRSLGSKWRIPTTKELVTLVTFKGFNDKGGQSIHPAIKNDARILTSEQYVTKSVDMIYLNFQVADIHYGGKANAIFSTLCVHDLGNIGNGIKRIKDDSKVDGRYEESEKFGTGAVLDNNTGKSWTRGSIGMHQYGTNQDYLEPKWNGANYDYNGLLMGEYPAFEACAKIGTGGWRMPTYYELLTLTDYRNKNSLNSATSMKYLDLLAYWSSNKLISEGFITQGYYVSFTDGTTGQAGTRGIEKFREVICIHD